MFHASDAMHETLGHHTLAENLAVPANAYLSINDRHPSLCSHLTKGPMHAANKVARVDGTFVDEIGFKEIRPEPLIHPVDLADVSKDLPDRDVEKRSNVGWE